MEVVPEKENAATELQLTEFQKNQTIDQLSRVLAVALNESSVRLMLHDEIGKQFTADYDILYSLIKDNVINTTQFGKIAFSKYLEEIARIENIEFHAFKQFESSFKNLQISSPVYFENWDFTTFKPIVISLPLNYETDLDLPITGYYCDGNSLKVIEKEINTPIILVRKSERIDDNGYLRVNPAGFVIPEEERVFTAKEVYTQSGSQDFITEISSVSDIAVISDVKFHEIVNHQRQIVGLSAKGGFDLETVADLFNNLNKKILKSGQVELAIPKVTKVFPDMPYSVRFCWEGVQGATKFEIWRQYSYFNPVNIATLSASDGWTNYLDQNLSSGQSYYYSIRAVDNAGNTSPMSAPYEAIPSWRRKGARDVVSQIYITDACWNWCCGLFDGKIELQYKAAYFDHLIKAASAYPGGSTNLNNFGQKTRSQQKGRWYIYTIHNYSRGPWSSSPTITDLILLRTMAMEIV